MIELKQMFRLKAGYFIFYCIRFILPQNAQTVQVMNYMVLPSLILSMNIDADDTRIKLLQKQQKSIYHKFNSLNRKVL